MIAGMARGRRWSGFLLAGSMLAVLGAQPARADAPADEARLRKLEAEVRALQRQVFPGSNGKYFTPEVATPAVVPTPQPGVPASTPLTDLLSRMDAVEAQIQRLTAQNEENTNHLAQLDAKLAQVQEQQQAAAAAAQAAAAPPIEVPQALPTPAPAPAGPAPKFAAVAAAAQASSARTPPARAAAPSAQRVEAVKAIEKPKTADPGDDDYSYGFRLWEAKFYPEAEQQLRIYVEKYPNHARISYGRNLLGRAFLDDGKPRDAAPWFLKNYQADKKGARAPDSLLNLAMAMTALKDTNRACIALAEFADSYPAEAAGRLKGPYDDAKSAVKCD